MDPIKRVMADLRTSCPANSPFWNFFLSFTHFIPTAVTIYLFAESWRTRDVVYKLGSVFSVVNTVVNYAVINLLRSPEAAPECMGDFDDDAYSVESAMFLFTFFILNRQLYNYFLSDEVVVVGVVWVFSTWIAVVTLGVQDITQAIVSSAIGTAVGFVSVLIIQTLYIPNREWLHGTRLLKVAKTRDTVYGPPIGHMARPQEIDPEVFEASVEAEVRRRLAARAPPPPPPEPEPDIAPPGGQDKDFFL